MVCASLVGGQARVVACMASAESGYGQKTGKVIYKSDGHLSADACFCILNGVAVFEPAEADRRVAAGQPAEDARARAQCQYRGQHRRVRESRAETEGR